MSEESFRKMEGRLREIATLTAALHAANAEAAAYREALAALVEACAPVYVDGYHCHACAEIYPAVVPEEVEHAEGCAYVAARAALAAGRGRESAEVPL